jgi:hypothetical protein
MNDDTYRPGVGLPMFARLTLSPDEAAGGATAEVDHAAAARADLESGLRDTGDGGTNSEKTSETASTATPTPATPATPAAPPAEDFQKKFEEYTKSEPERRRQAEEAALERFARSSPQAWKLVTGQEPPPGQFPEAAKPAGAEPDAAADPNDELRKRLETIEQREQRREREAKARETQNQLFEEFDRHEDVFSSEKNKLADWAQQAAANAVKSDLQAGRRPDMRKIVDDIAKAYRDHDEARKSTYVVTKTKTAETVLPGAGSGGGATPGKPPAKLKIGKGAGTYRNVLDEALKGDRD